jgi:hypothetical protein
MVERAYPRDGLLRVPVDREQTVVDRRNSEL